MNIIVLYGGRSGEHEISLISASSVARNLGSEHKITLIGITKDGIWYKQPDEELNRIRTDKNAVLKIAEDEKNTVQLAPGLGKNASFRVSNQPIACDIVFPVLHGTYGEDGTLQGLLEMIGIPYVGCGVVSSAITMDKDMTKKIWNEAGLPIVPGVCLTRHDISDYQAYDEMLDKIIEKFGYPLFVKPCSAGSSDGANKATNYRELSMALMEAFQWDDKVLIEKAIDAREIECAVTGNAVNDDFSNENDLVQAYSLGEIAPKKKFYDYDAKYNDPDGAELLIPAQLEKDISEKIKSIAVKAYTATDAAGLARVDFFIDKNDGKIYLNEINTMPGFTSISMFPKLCIASGLEYPKILERLICEGINRFDARKNLRFSR